MFRFVGLAFIAILAASSAAGETVRLELKKVVQPIRRYPGTTATKDVPLLFWHCQPQSLVFENGEYSDPTNFSEFHELIGKEPAPYLSTRPFKGVFRLGSDRVAFVLDGEDTTAKGYDRIHIDINRNGDLTDDGMIEALNLEPYFVSEFPVTRIYGRYNLFPLMEITFVAGGGKVDYAFAVSVVSPREGSRIDRVEVSLYPAVYREGEITIQGHRQKIVLCDLNSNGRFDDSFKACQVGEYNKQFLYPGAGDGIYLPHEDDDGDHILLWNERFQWVGKILGIEGSICDFETTPSGGEITLAPSTIPLGEVTTPHRNFSALLYSELGVMMIRCGEKKKTVLPVGAWNLWEYKLNWSGRIVNARAVPATSNIFSRPLPDISTRYTHALTAAGKEDTSTIMIRAGETTALPFGPPYRPGIEVAASGTDPETSAACVDLKLTLTGPGNEVVKGISPRLNSPRLKIASEDGSLVEEGWFEKSIYGIDRYSFRWHLPGDLQDRYVATVLVDDSGPFAIASTETIVLHKEALLNKQ